MKEIHQFYNFIHFLNAFSYQSSLEWTITEHSQFGNALSNGAINTSCLLVLTVSRGEILDAFQLHASVCLHWKLGELSWTSFKRYLEREELIPTLRVIFINQLISCQNLCWLLCRQNSCQETLTGTWLRQGIQQGVNALHPGYGPQVVFDDKSTRKFQTV